VRLPIVREEVMVPAAETIDPQRVPLIRNLKEEF
jgi:hypothetical protein